MEIVGIGTDIVECLRIGRMIEQHGELFLNRVYTEREVRYCQARKRRGGALRGTLGSQGSDPQVPRFRLAQGAVLDRYGNPQRSQRPARGAAVRRRQGVGAATAHHRRAALHLPLPGLRHGPGGGGANLNPWEPFAAPSDQALASMSGPEAGFRLRRRGRRRIASPKSVLGHDLRSFVSAPPRTPPPKRSPGAARIRLVAGSGDPATTACMCVCVCGRAMQRISPHPTRGKANPAHTSPRR